MRTLSNNPSDPFESVRQFSVTEWGNGEVRKWEREREREGTSGKRKERQRERESSRFRNSEHWVIIVDISTRRNSSTIYIRSPSSAQRSRERERKESLNWHFPASIGFADWIASLLAAPKIPGFAYRSIYCRQYTLKRLKRERGETHPIDHWITVCEFLRDWFNNLSTSTDTSQPEDRSENC